MSDLRTAAQQALECLKGVARGKYDGNAAGVCAALEAALAQQAEPVQEPAFHGFMSDDGTQVDVCFSPSAPRRDGTYATAYYTAPPHRVAQQAEPVEEPYTSERHFALREAYCIGAADAFWKARPGTKDDGRTIAFDAGFARGFDKGTCLAEQRLAALAQRAEPAEPVDVGLLEYRGNSVAFIHQKMTAYRAGIDAAWDAFRAKGLHPDGKTPLANMIAKYTAPPQRKPLTEEEIESCRQQGYAHAGLGAPFDFGKAARAVERAHGIKE